jgi:hypothetical protein
MTQRDQPQRRLHRLRTDVVLGTRARACLIDGLAREHAERDRDLQRRRELGQGPRDRVSEDVEVRGLTSYQAAERDDRVEASRPCEHCDRRWQLERAGDLELLDLRAFRECRLDGTLRERPGDLVVPPRSYDRDARTGRGILHPRRRLPTGRHLPQSSPCMQRYPVSG